MTNETSQMITVQPRPLSDAVQAALALLLASPLLSAYAAIGLVCCGRAFDTEDGALVRFASAGPLSGLASLIPVVTGSRRIIGPRPRRDGEPMPANLARHVPGLISNYRIARMMGVPPQSEDLSDCEMMDALSLRPTIGTILRYIMARAFGGGARLVPAEFNLLGVRIDNLDMQDAVARVTGAARGQSCVSIAFVNADCLNTASRIPAYARVLGRQHSIFADGSGLRLGAKLRGISLNGNVNGTDMFPHLCEAAAGEGLPIFLLGAQPGIAEKVAENMQARFDGLKIAGFADGFFKPEEEEGLIDRINASGARILLVAMGAPRQELWIARNLDRLSPGVALGVGGLFDFYSGRISRAPLWMRQTGIEWVWRLMQEPGRMWKRYLVGNFTFVYRALNEQRTIARSTSVARFGWQEQERARRRITGWKKGSRLRVGLKRVLDIFGAGTGIILLSPVLIATALAIRLESPGPVFFTQTRVGLRGKRFRVWKFRSMYIDAEARRATLLAQSDRQGTHFKMKQDPRITRVGRFIRRTSIDELPQLFNVLNGTMSIVGPRPNLEAEVARYQIDEFGRLDVKPGITCTWQVSGRAELPWDRQVALDLDYAYDPSILADISLIVRTVPAVVSGRGAY